MFDKQFVLYIVHTEAHLTQLNKESKMLKTKSPYNFKKLAPMIMLALSPVAFTACDGDKEIVQKPVTIPFNIRAEKEDIIADVKAAAQREDVNIVYLKKYNDKESWNIGHLYTDSDEHTPGTIDTWEFIKPQRFSDYVVNGTIKPCMEASPKVRCQGKFVNLQLLRNPDGSLSTQGRADSLLMVRAGFELTHCK